MQREKIYSTLFNLLSTLNTLTSKDENYTITLSPYQIYVLWYGRYVSNVYVKKASDGTTLTQIFSGTPTTGQYLVDSQGLYTFAAADVGLSINITYQYTGIVTSQRSLLHWNDVSPAMMPCMFMVQKSEKNIQIKGLPPRWEFEVEVYLYINSPNDPNFIPAKLLNPLLDELEALLAPDATQDTQTLGGLVSHCWISQPIVTAEGQISDGEVALIPINILVPS